VKVFLRSLLRMNTSAEAEVHRFEERVYVTTGWVTGWAVAAPPDAGPAELGALVKQALRESRRDPEPLFIDRRSDRRDERHEREWERFCREVAGTTVIGYRPEIRIDVSDDGEGTLALRPLDAHSIPDLASQVRLASDVDTATLGEALERLLAESPPHWPTVRRATLSTEAGGRLVVYPFHDICAAGPVRVVAADVDDASLGREIRAALDDSRRETGDSGEFGPALAEEGLDERDLAGGAQVGIRETSRGAIDLDPAEPHRGGWRSAGRKETIEDGDPEVVARTALAMLRRIRPRHRKPGALTGASFAYKIAWLAVRTEHSDDVVEALGLTDRRKLGWTAGVAGAHERGVFVTPATSGWTLAVGVGWFEQEPDIAALSERLGAEVQVFMTHRVFEAHVWALARDGEIVRRLSFVGESGAFAEDGEPTEVERDLGLAGLDEDTAGEAISEDTVLEVARAWSIDPRELETTPTCARTGIHGDLPS
jgi:hypothetical protein